MKPSAKNATRVKDDSLYGLLSSHKASCTYLRVLVSEEDDSVILQLTGNPKNFNAITTERYKNYRVLRRLEIGASKQFLKYVAPENLIAVLGPMLELNIPPDRVVITDSLKKDGIYALETSLKYKLKMTQGIRKILNMSPQKRYEVIEKFISGNQEQ
ncbi:MAG TPA: hypothetical protein PLM53_10125 [Spirochaetota bacterium]|nr:hypothetical protein [Spirochaetota bacterium]HPC41061.1 hypothetical protein [Spirochaetota bacterium]HPL18791.1 hypothetical protein [Spirochaetota bacterium]HQF08826.1 hypothetical protein [Spirochaetota bacterium]HQH97445.1 hypothetical protein [Spirochaetota bacterium]